MSRLRHDSRGTRLSDALVPEGGSDALVPEGGSDVLVPEGDTIREKGSNFVYFFPRTEYGLENTVLNNFDNGYNILIILHNCEIMVHNLENSVHYFPHI